MAKDLTRRQLLQVLGISAASACTSRIWTWQKHYFDNSQRLQELTDQCNTELPEGEPFSLSVTFKTKNYFYDQALVEVYSANEKLLSKGYFSQIPKPGEFANLTLDNFILEPGTRIKVTNKEEKSVAFTLPEEKEMITGDSWKDGKESAELMGFSYEMVPHSLSVQAQVFKDIPILRVQSDHLQNPESHNHCKFVKIARLYVMRDGYTF